MSIFDRFNRFKNDIIIKTEQGDFVEKATFTRVGRANTSNFKSNFVYTVLLDNNTILKNGDVFECNIYGRTVTFITVSVRKTSMSIQATVYECNCNISIQRLAKQYDENDNLIGNNFTEVLNISANYVTVNSNMRMLDAGLLPSTTKEFRMSVCNIKLMDRIVLEGNKYCVDSIDETKFNGMYAVQVSIDERS